MLVVEANNREATSLYKKLGYRGIGGEPDTPNLVVNGDGKVVEGRVRTVLMRKSLKEGAAGAFENVDPAAVVGVGAVAAAAAKFVADGGVSF